MTRYLGPKTDDANPATQGDLDGLGGGGFTVSTTPPSSPSVGDTWYKSDTGQMFVYYDSFWVETGNGKQGPAGATGETGPAGTFTSAKDTLANDVTMTTGGTFYSGPSLSLAAGTHLVTAVATVASPNNAAMRVTARLDNNAASVFYGEAQQSTAAAGGSTRGVASVPISTLIVLGSTTTVRLQATSTAASCILKAEANDSSSLADAATTIVAVKVA